MKFISLAILFLFVLAACGQPAGLETPTTAPTETEIILPTPPETSPPTCSTLDIQPTPGAESNSLFPPVSALDHARGAQDGAVTIIVYNDFQCADCNYLPLSQKLMEAHPQDVRIVYRYYPYTDYFDKAELAARAAEAAASQGQFWEMHDLLFERQADWVERSPASFEGWVKVRAQELGLDPARFEADFQSPEIVEKVQQATQHGEELGIPVLPFFLVNGQIYTASDNFDTFNHIISLLAMGERQYTECPPVVIDPSRQYLATLSTEKGEVVVQLFADKAPLAVNSFVFLARAGWFNDITFHRVLPGFVAQTGDPSGTGEGNPGYLFKNELDAGLKFDKPGVLAMANSGPDTNGSQFFITLAPAPHLNGSYTIFGQVLRGQEVLEALSPRDPQPGEVLPPGDRLVRVSIEER